MTTSADISEENLDDQMALVAAVLDPVFGWEPLQ